MNSVEWVCLGLNAHIMLLKCCPTGNHTEKELKTDPFSNEILLDRAILNLSPTDGRMGT